jgi:heme A synthase
MTHRYAVVILGLALVLLVWYVFRERQSTAVRRLAVGTFALYLMQSGIGALYVLTTAASWAGAAHVGLAAATWALLVCLSIIETLNSQTQPQAALEQGNSDGIYRKTVA